MLLFRLMGIPLMLYILYGYNVPCIPILCRCAWILLGRTSAMKSADGLELVPVPSRFEKNTVNGRSKQPKLGVISYT